MTELEKDQKIQELLDRIRDLSAMLGRWETYASEELIKKNVPPALLQLLIDSHKTGVRKIVDKPPSIWIDSMSYPDFA